MLFSRATGASLFGSLSRCLIKPLVQHRRALALSSKSAGHAGGLLRDYKKDLDVFQRIGMMPGDIMNARELLMLIYKRVTSTTEVCGYGTGEATSNEWSVCSGPTENAGYAKARETVVFSADTER
ncbi:MAG TPA: hypothetical protein DIC52_22835 [Candidatus Latescibacteria bacterium]|nr:hypothetical protein [Candidatus Latescibacterota bacterium]